MVLDESAVAGTSPRSTVFFLAGSDVQTMADSPVGNVGRAASDSSTNAGFCGPACRDRARPGRTASTRASGEADIRRAGSRARNARTRNAWIGGTRAGSALGPQTRRATGTGCGTIRQTSRGGNGTTRRTGARRTIRVAERRGKWTAGLESSWTTCRTSGTTTACGGRRSAGRSGRTVAWIGRPTQDYRWYSAGTRIRHGIRRPTRLRIKESNIGRPRGYAGRTRTGKE